jgi:hypothetical protein
MKVMGEAALVELLNPVVVESNEPTIVGLEEVSKELPHVDFPRTSANALALLYWKGFHKEPPGVIAYLKCILCRI